MAGDKKKKKKIGKKKYGGMIFPFENVSRAPVLNFEDGVYVCYTLGKSLVRNSCNTGSFNLFQRYLDLETRVYKYSILT